MAKRSIDIVINGRDKSRKAFDGANKSIIRIERAAKAAGAAIAATLSVRAGVSFGKDLINLASDAEEAASKFEFVFSGAADSVGRRLDLFSQQAGRSRFELREMAGDIGALVRPMGLTEEAAGDMSVQVAKLATDLASFFNSTDQEALTALRAGLVGESEPLRRYGVQLSAARIEQEAFNAGLAKTKAEVTGAAKAQAIMNIVMQDTAGAQGDAIRTSDGYANSTRRLAGEWKDFKTELGQEILPVASEVLNTINDINTSLGGLGNTIRLIFAEAKAGIGDYASFMSSLSPHMKIAEALGFTGISDFSTNASVELIRLRQKIAADVAARDQAQRDAEGEGGRPGFGGGPFVGPQLPPGGLEAWRAGQNGAALELPEVSEIVLPNVSTPPGGERGPGLVQGRLLTGLAQITRDNSVQREVAKKIDEGNRTQRENRDLLRQIKESLAGSQPVIVGMMANG